MKTNFDFQPTLTGTRVVIRPIAHADWSGMFLAGSDPDIWALHPVRDRYLEPGFREFFDGAVASGSAFTFADRATGAIFGSSRYHGFDPAASEIEIGWTFLTREYWGGSYNLEIKRLMLDHAFNWVETVVFWVGDTNWRSRRAMEKIGGVLRDETELRCYGGETYNHVVYEIRKGQWR